MAARAWYHTRRRLRVLPVWPLPLALLATGAFLSWLLPLLDRHLDGWEEGYGGAFYPEVDDSAMSNLLSAVAGGMITLTGLVFTALTLAMQFGSTHLSVRVVPILRQDPVLRWSIGTFLATFIYTLLVSARLAVREADYRPVASVLFAIVLSMLCALLFLALVTRVTGIFNSSYLLRTLAAQGRQAIERTHPATAVAESAEHARTGEPEVVRLGAVPRQGQVLLSFDAVRLHAIARASGVELELVPLVGDFLVQDAPLFLVYGPAPRLDSAKLARCLIFGDTHSPTTDPAGALRVLVDVALKALSPAINDPGRAVQALDHIEGMLVMLAPRLHGSSRLAGTRWLRYRTRSWADYVCIATDEIRHYGGESLQVQRRLRALYATVARACAPEQIEPLTTRIEALDADAATQWPHALDRRLAGRPDAQGLGTEQGSALTAPDTGD